MIPVSRQTAIKKKKEKKRSGRGSNEENLDAKRLGRKKRGFRKVSELLAACLRRQIPSHAMQIRGFLDVLDIVRKCTAKSNRSCKIIMGGFHCLARDVGKKRRFEVGLSFPVRRRHRGVEAEEATVPRTL